MTSPRAADTVSIARAHVSPLANGTDVAGAGAGGSPTGNKTARVYRTTDRDREQRPLNQRGTTGYPPLSNPRRNESPDDSAVRTILRRRRKVIYVRIARAKGPGDSSNNNTIRSNNTRHDDRPTPSPPRAGRCVGATIVRAASTALSSRQVHTRARVKRGRSPSTEGSGHRPRQASAPCSPTATGERRHLTRQINSVR